MNRKQIIVRLRQLREELRSADEARVQAITDEVNELKAQLSQMEQRDALFDGLDLDTNDNGGPLSPVDRRGAAADGGNENETPEQRRARVLASPEYRSAWLNNLRHMPLTEAEQRAMSTATTSAGAAAPTTTANMIVERLEQTSVLYARIGKSAIPGNFRMPRETAATAASWKAENAAITAGDPSLDDVVFAGYELVKLVTVSKAALKMTIDAFEAYIVNQIVRKMAIAIEAAIISGNGSASGEPTGILTGVTFTAGKNKATYKKGENPTYDNVMDTLALLPSAYHPEAVWLCNTKTKYGKLNKIKDNEGRPMFTDGRIDGKEVIAADQMPDGKLLLCCLSYYHWNTQGEIAVDISDQAGFRNAQVDYRGYAVMDGKPLLDEAFVMLEEAAA